MIWGPTTQKQYIFSRTVYHYSCTHREFFQLASILRLLQIVSKLITLLMDFDKKDIFLLWVPLSTHLICLKFGGVTFNTLKFCDVLAAYCPNQPATNCRILGYYTLMYDTHLRHIIQNLLFLGKITFTPPNKSPNNNLVPLISKITFWSKIDFLHWLAHYIIST